MSETMQLEIVSATEAAVKVSVKEVYVPGCLGETGILENHKPFVSLLEPGEINYTDVHGKKTFLFVKEGFVEVVNNNIVVISDTVESGVKLDREKVDNRLAEIEQAMVALQAAKDMSADDLQAAPAEWDKILAEKREWDVKRSIIEKVSKQK